VPAIPNNHGLKRRESRVSNKAWARLSDDLSFAQRKKKKKKRGGSCSRKMDTKPGGGSSE